MNYIRNSVQLMGHLGKEVDLKTFDSGKSKASFSIATNDYYKNNKGEKVTETQWHNIVAWGKLATNMQSTLKKGSQVVIRGKLTSRSYEDNAGTKKYISEIIASEFVSMDQKE